MASGSSKCYMPPCTLSETGLMPCSGSTHAEGSTVQDPELSHSAGWEKGGQERGWGGKMGLTYTAHSSFSLRIDQ